MTTQTLFSDKAQARSKSFSAKYFLYELSSSWPRALLYFIVFFLVLPLPILLFYGDVEGYDHAQLLIRNTSNLLEHISSALPVLIPIFSSIIAVFAGCAATRYMNNKVSADFYHSLPIRRETLFSTRYIVGAIDYLISIILNGIITILIATLICEISPGFDLEIIKGIISALLSGILYFFVIYGMSVLAGTLCGTTFMQIAMTGYIGLIIPTVLSMPLLLMSTFNSVLDASYYFTFIVEKLSPVTRLFLLIDLPLNAAETIGYILLAVAFFAVGILIYKKRRSERAGNSIVFTGLARVFKFSVMFPAIVLLAVLMQEISGSYGWLIIGALLGGLLSFMLLNTIINLNPRTMFKGLRGGVICTVITILFIVFISSDAFDVRVPRASQVNYIEVDVGDTLDSFKTDNEKIIYYTVEFHKSGEKRRVDYIDDSVIQFEDYEETYESYYKETIEVIDGVGVEVKDISEKYVWSYPDGYYVRVIYHLKGGIPLAFNGFYVENSMCVDSLNFLETIADSEDYKDYLIDKIEQFDNVPLDQINTYTHSNEMYGLASMKVTRSMLDAMKAQAMVVSYDKYQNTVLATVNLNSYYDNQNNYFNYDVMRNSVMNDSILNMNKKTMILENITSIVLMKRPEKQGEPIQQIKISDRAIIDEVLSSITSFGTWGKSIFTKVDEGYCVGIETSYEYGERVYNTNFIYGKVPQSVINLFK